MIVNPINTGLVAGKTIRFFKGPSGKPEMPWHAADDLFVACGLNRAMRRQFAQMQQRIFGADIRTIATSDGPVVIAPHLAAQALLGAATEAGPRLSGTILEDYAHAAAQALEKAAGERGADDFVGFMLEAARNSGVGE